MVCPPWVWEVMVCTNGGNQFPLVGCGGNIQFGVLRGRLVMFM